MPIYQDSENNILFCILRYLVIICIAAILIALAIFSTIIHSSGYSEDREIRFTVTQDIEIHSSNAILFSIKDDEVLYAKENAARAYPASMTKVMTAIVALENIEDLNDTMVLNKEIYDSLLRTGASVAGFQLNERVKIIDLLYGLMIKSGAECSIGLATYVAGSDTAFVKLMNEKAKEIGMNDTHFVNSVGLHDPNHYSTANDILTLLKYALNNETLRTLITTPEHRSQPTNNHPKGLLMKSHMFALVDNSSFTGLRFMGGKTGFTNEGRYCLASFGEKFGEEFIVVTFNAPEIEKDRSFHMQDTRTIFKAIDMYMLD